MVRSRLLIIQPGKFGDIIICLPIAKYYYDMGHAIYWECPKMYHEIFHRVHYVNPIESAADWVAFTDTRFDHIIDLSFGFGGAPEQWWRESVINFNKFQSFVEAKYALARVPLEERWKLQFTRDFKAEHNLFMQTATYVSDYNLVHYQGSLGPDITNLIPEGNTNLIFQPYVGSTIFDWYQVIGAADEIHCIDSSLSNFIEVIPEFRDKKKYLYDVRESYSWLKSIYRNNWIIV